MFYLTHGKATDHVPFHPAPSVRQAGELTAEFGPEAAHWWSVDANLLAC